MDDIMERKLSEVGKSYAAYRQDTLAVGWMPCEEKAWNRMKSVYREHWHLQALIQQQGIEALTESDDTDGVGG